MNGTKSYDADLRMFRETPREVNLAHLQFMRWLVEQGRMDRPPSGPPSGPFTGETEVVTSEAA